MRTQRHVGIWLWKDSRALADRGRSSARSSTSAATLGVVGAKIDFFDHEAKEMIDRYQSILRESAERHIMVNFHGANKPAGEARTWPHELTREGVYGLEHRQAPEWARHNTTLPFTRFLAGAADYTPVVFGERRKETSWAHQIATAVVFTSPLLVFGGHPQSLLDNPAVEMIKSLPSVWDETIVLPVERDRRAGGVRAPPRDDVVHRGAERADGADAAGSIWVFSATADTMRSSCATRPMTRRRWSSRRRRAPAGAPLTVELRAGRRLHRAPDRRP